VSYVWAWPGFQDWRFYDAFLQADLGPSLARERSALRILSEDRQRRWLTFAVESDRGDEVVYRKSSHSHRLVRTGMNWPRCSQ
jgi:hypothetical protein